MKNKIFATFISTAYNVNKYLDDFFSSFMRLQKDKFEIIFVDDKGKEDPREIVDRWSKSLPIKFVDNHKNLGTGAARNSAHKFVSSKATHIIYLDPDDKIDESFSFSELHLNKVTIFKSKKWYVDKVVNWPLNGWMLWRNDIPHGIGGTAFPAKEALETKFWLRTFEDTPVVADIIKKCEDRIYFSNKYLLVYRVRKSSATHGKGTSEKAKSLHDAFKYLWEKGYIPERNVGRIYEFLYKWCRKANVNMIWDINDSYSSFKKFMRRRAIDIQLFLKFDNWAQEKGKMHD